MSRALAAKSIAVATASLVSAGAFAAGQDVTQGAQAAQGSLGTPQISSILSTVTDVLIFFVGAISVIVLIIGGLRYIVSAGNAAAVQGAKNTILYAIVGIVVSISAYAIVHFVLTQFS